MIRGNDVLINVGKHGRQTGTSHSVSGGGRVARRLRCVELCAGVLTLGTQRTQCAALHERGGHLLTQRTSRGGGLNLCRLHGLACGAHALKHCACLVCRLDGCFQLGYFLANCLELGHVAFTAFYGFQLCRARHACLFQALVNSLSPGHIHSFTS